MTEMWTREAIHKIVFDDAMHALKIGAPGLSDESRHAVAINIAVRASHHLHPKDQIPWDLQTR
jgi:hypothetical protein